MYNSCHNQFLILYTWCSVCSALQSMRGGGDSLNDLMKKVVFPTDATKVGVSNLAMPLEHMSSMEWEGPWAWPVQHSC